MTLLIAEGTVLAISTYLLSLMTEVSFHFICERVAKDSRKIYDEH